MHRYIHAIKVYPPRQRVNSPPPARKTALHSGICVPGLAR
ncbi:Hypothetical protein SmN45_1338 [Serratia marcescens]|nr:Hypothetical protein SmN45_1338 [Serratia marcescens]